MRIRRGTAADLKVSVAIPEGAETVAGRGGSRDAGDFMLVQECRNILHSS